MAEFIDILSPSALKDLREANVEVLELIKNIDKTGVAMKAVKTPSGSNDAIKKTTESYNQLEKQFVKINKLTSEEIVNQRALAQASDRQAKAVSLLVGAYQNLNAKHQQAKKSLQDLIVSGRRADETQAKYNTRLKEAQREFNLLDTQIKKADKAVGVFNRNVGNYPTKAIGGLKDLLGAFGVVGGATGIAMIAKDIYETTKQLQSLNMALLQVSESQEKMASTQAFLARISEAYGVEIMGLTKQFTQFYVSAKDKISGQEIEDIFDSIAKASASMGLTQEQTERAFLALNQMMSKGTVSAEELRGQLGEALPGAFGIMAKAMGVTEKQLGKMMKDGDVLASDVLPRFARQLEITYGIENVNRINNIASAQNRIANQWTAFVDSLSSSDPKNGISFFQKVMMSAEGLLLILTRLNTSWDELYKKASLKGEEFGKNNVSKLLNNIVGSEKQLKEAESIIRVAQNNISSITKQINDLEAKLKNTSPYALRMPWSQSPKDIKLQIEGLKEFLGENNGMIESAKTFIEQSKVKTKVKTEEDKITKEQIKGKKNEIKASKELEQVNSSSLNALQKTISALKESYENAEIGSVQYGLLANQIKLLETIYDGLTKSAEASTEAISNGEGIALNLGGSEFITDEDGDRLKEEGDRLREILRDFKQGFVDDFADQSGFSLTLDLLSGGLDKFEGDAVATALAVSEAFQQAFNTISQMSNQNFEVERENLQKKYDNAILFANGEESAIAEINRQKEAKEREIRNRQAKANKNIALFNIALNTAQGIVAALTSVPPNIPLSIGIGIIGAAQLAVVASQQIPQYFRGTDNHKGGLMQINDGGGSNFKEIVQTPDGKMRMYNERDKVLNAPKGTKVFTAQKSMDMLSFDNNLNNILLNSGIGNAPKIEVNNQGMSDAQVDRIVSTIQNKTEYIPTFNQNGFNMYVRNGHTTKEITNRRIQGQSYGV